MVAEMSTVRMQFGCLMSVLWPLITLIAHLFSLFLSLSLPLSPFNLCRSPVLSLGLVWPPSSHLLVQLVCLPFPPPFHNYMIYLSPLWTVILPSSPGYVFFSFNEQGVAPFSTLPMHWQGADEDPYSVFPLVSGFPPAMRVINPASKTGITNSSSAFLYT